VWERKTDTLLEFLEWLETDAVAKPQGGRGDAFDRAPRLPVSLHVRLGTFTSDKFMKALAAGLLAIGEWRQTLAQLDEDKVSLAKVNAVRLEVDRHLNDMHVFVRNEVGLMPQVSEKVTPAFFAARQERRQATDN
jgi:hypothetical protein